MLKFITFVFVLLLNSNYCSGSIYLQNKPEFNSPTLQFLMRVGKDYGFSIDNYDDYNYLKVYDFVIVGSGPAGSVLANRLSENPNHNVLLIEAGKVETFIQNVPVMAAYMQSTAYTWDYLTEPQTKSCLGMKGNRCGFPRGKALGGTSVINYMIYNRGNKEDFNRWAAAGNIGWSWKDVLPYFIKSEHSTLDNLRNSPNHGHNGPLNVEYNRHRSVIAEAFVEGNKMLGLKEVDYNSGLQLGVSYLQANTLNGVRHSAFRAFIQPAKTRPNLHIMINTRATKVLIDPNTKFAYGVEYVRNKQRYQVLTKKEVILSAGTFNSPQLLMLSGIGMKNDLERIKVPLIKDLPVGNLMYDHISHFGPTFIVNSTGVSINSDRLLNLRDIMKYLQGKGEFTTPGGVEALSFIKTKSGNSYGPSVPDVELIFVPSGLQADQGTGIARGMKFTEDIYNSIYKQLEDSRIDVFSVMLLLFHPKSVGYMTLKDNNPFHWPKFYPKFFENEDDIETMLEGIKYVMRLAQTEPFQRLGARIHDVPLPNCAHLHFGSDEYWRCSIRTLSCTLHHQVSTCKMGPQSDPTSIVSPELKVHGIKNLRVADCSIIPEPTTSHTNAASFMIGEKAADMIKQEWKGRD